ncbi:lytic polysaccharide monooxygenase [Glycomyces terrestris]|uniref:Cellulose-binding protein n=1 Tax=Glycomyces terrestris TaxID=2493553 RepID=A0A426V0H5_9ACTN|nr:lytic polysaccharide monooxygenase [Glycomyces terrestris]RRS00337.1 cellulose-binding protein [Glycomyces terrestris]
MIRATRHRARQLIVLVAALAAAGASAFFFLQPAAGHGTATSPPSRQYSCWERWGDDHLNPDMADTDPMCAQAWQANPNTMWNWNGLLREGMAGQHETRIPDNQLCSGGRAEGGRYNSLDAAGAWHTTPLNNNFTLHYEDTAVHGGDYYWVYVSKQGYDATTDSLDWADLERVVSTGVYEPGEAVDIPVSAPGRTGRHVVYVVWQASHIDQAFYSCSDVWFGGGGPTDPPTDPTDPPTDPTDPPTDPTDPPADLSCSATASVNSWGSGATVTVTVANTGTRTVNSWMLHWAWATGSTATVGSIWNAEHSTMGGMQMAAPVGWNKTIAAGGSVSFGFNVNGSLSTMPEIDCLPS